MIAGPARSGTLAMRQLVPGGMTIPAAVRETGPELASPAAAVFDSSRRYRYLLTRTWDDSCPPAVWVMLNPSTADAFTDDPTIRRCIRFAACHGAGGIIVVNLFAYRAADPAALRGAADPVGEFNDAFIRQAGQPAGRLIIAAWGAHGTLGGRADAVTGMLTAAGAHLHCLGTTRHGQPRHPLYLPGGTRLTTYQPAATAGP
jgi:hypothetical protein